MAKRRDKAEPPGSSAAGIIMLLLAGVDAVLPQLRNWYFIAAAGAFGLLMTFIGSGRVYRPAVTVAGDTITCRFNPWREGTFYLSLIGVPLIGCMMIVGGNLSDRGSPGLWHVVGVLVIAATPIPVFVLLRQASRSRLCISPGALSVSIPGQDPATTEIPRAAVHAACAAPGRLGNGATAPVTEITYQSSDSAGGGTRTVSFGPTNTKKTAWLTVEQSDLLAGLQAWYDGDPAEPALMDRVARTLRGGGMVRA